LNRSNYFSLVKFSDPLIEKKMTFTMAILPVAGNGNKDSDVSSRTCRASF
jgi:hypothetical protein